MANHKKFNASTAFKIIRHVERIPHNYRNKDIDLNRSKDNTVIFDYGFKKYKTRLDGLSRVKGFKEK